MLKHALLTGLLGVLSVTLTTTTTTRSAVAQQRPASQGQGVMLLISEVTHSGAEASSSSDAAATTFWWKDLERPTISPMHATLQKELASRGVTWSPRGFGGKRISKIYRRADLAQENAIALGRLLGGAERLYHGQVSYHPVEAPLGLSMEPGVVARVEIDLIDLESGSASDVRLVLERVAFGATRERARASVEDEIAGAMARLMSRGLSFASGPVGPGEELARERGGEDWIVLKGAQNEAHVERAMQRITSLDEVQDVRIAWASKGYIALDVNPRTRDGAQLIERVKRTLFESEETPAQPSDGAPWRWVEAEAGTAERELANCSVLVFVESTQLPDGERSGGF